MENNEFEKLFSRCYRKAYRAAKSICFNRHLAEDAVSEAAIRMMSALRKGFVRADADHYFIKIAVNEAKRLCAKTREYPTDDISAYLEVRSAQAEYDRESMRLLIESVGKLNQKLRLPIQMHYFGGFSEVETARLLGISYSAVKARIMRARQKLKEMLEREEIPEGGIKHEI